MVSMIRNIFFVVAFVSLTAQAANELVITDFSSRTDGKGVPAGWELKEKSGRADLRIIQVDGKSGVQLRSTNTSFSLQRGVKADITAMPYLSWKWKVTRLPEGGDFRKSKTDDQAAQLFVAFNRTQAIVYIWDTSAPEGLMADAPSPPFISIKAVVVRSKANRLGEWLSETRNVYADYRKFYGDSEKTPVVSGVRLQINTQHTRSAAESFFADVVFHSDEKKVAKAPEAGSRE